MSLKMTYSAYTAKVREVRERREAGQGLLKTDLERAVENAQKHLSGTSISTYSREFLEFVAAASSYLCARISRRGVQVQFRCEWEYFLTHWVLERLNQMDCAVLIDCSGPSDPHPQGMIG